MSPRRRRNRKKAKSSAKPNRASIERAESVARPSSINRYGFAVAVALLGGMLGLALYLGPGRTPSPGEEPLRILEPESEDEPALPPLEQWKAAERVDLSVEPGRDFIRGPERAPVTIVEFSDFQCPYCRTAAGALDEVLEAHPDTVRLVFKNFPLDMACNEDMKQPLHADACRAAVMGRCAGASDPSLFWRFHDAVFEAPRVDAATLDAIAASLGLTGPAFRNCLDSEEVLEDVREDIALALRLDLTSTPSLFVNDRYASSYRVEDLNDIIGHVLRSQ